MATLPPASRYYPVNTDHTGTDTEHTGMLLEGDCTAHIIGAFHDVYRELGYGFLETAYSRAIGLELQRRGVGFEREVPVEVTYLGVPIGRYRVDMIVSGKVLVEVKASKALTDADTRQVLNYLKATDLQVGLLLHFGPTPKFHRFLFTNDRKAR